MAKEYYIRIGEQQVPVSEKSTVRSSARLGRNASAGKFAPTWSAHWTFS